MLGGSIFFSMIFFEHLSILVKIILKDKIFSIKKYLQYTDITMEKFNLVFYGMEAHMKNSIKIDG